MVETEVIHKKFLFFQPHQYIFFFTKAKNAKIVVYAPTSLKLVPTGYHITNQEFL